MSLITLESAVAQLRIDLPTGSPAGALEAELLEAMAAAEAIVLGYLKTPDPGWTDAETTPADVRRAILVQLAELWRFRGDDPIADTPNRDGEISPTVRALLRMYRDPALA